MTMLDWYAVFGGSILFMLAVALGWILLDLKPRRHVSMWILLAETVVLIGISGWAFVTA